MKLSHFHLILSQCSSLVTEQVLDTSQLFRESRGADDSIRNLSVRHNLPTIYCLAHVKIDSKTGSGEVRWEQLEEVMSLT